MTDNEELKIIKLLKSGSVNAKIAFELIKGFGYTELKFMLMLWDKYAVRKYLNTNKSLFKDYNVRITVSDASNKWLVRPHVINDKYTKVVFKQENKAEAFKAFIEKLKTYD